MLPLASRRRNRFTWLGCSSTLNHTRAYASLYVARSVFFAYVPPLVVLPSTASAPELTLLPSTTSPPEVLQALRSPDSKPSAKTGAGGGGVVADAVALSGDTLPATSRARTAYWCVDPPSTASL